MLNTELLAPLPHTYVGKGRYRKLIISRDLPAPGSFVRWTPQRKALFLNAVRDQLLSKEMFLASYCVSAEEFEKWQTAKLKNGVKGLRVTKHLQDAAFGTTQKQEIAAPNQLVHLFEGSVTLSLTPREAQVLAYFTQHRNKAVSQTELVAHLFGDKASRWAFKNLGIVVYRLRKKLHQAGSSTCVETIWGRGYMLVCETRQAKLAA